MAETKTKKIRIYKLASEYNLSSESLVEFLRDKGYKVKSHMSIVNDEMMKDIRDNFKKDIEKAEKHYKKIAEFQQKMAEKTSKDERSATIEKEEEEELEAEEEELEEESEEAEAEDTETDETVEEEDEELPEEEAEEDEDELAEEEAEEKAAEEDVAAEKETTEEDVEKPVEAEKDEKKEERAKKEEKKEKKKEEPETADNRRRPKGLKVLGKMDLDEDKKKKPVKKKKDKQEDSAKKKTGVHPVSADDDKEQGKKKKRRRKKRKGEQEGESGKRKRKSKKFEIDEKQVQESIRRTMMSMDESASSSRQSAKKKRRKDREEREEKEQELAAEEKETIEVTEYIAVSELANLMNVPVSEVIQKCISLGLMVSINQRLEEDTITLVADEFGFEVEFAKEYKPDELEDEKDEEKDLKPRSAVVTIMGHVDHGKTSLLDHIRSENVVAGESGGITQHIGAYKVEVDKGKYITFLDTPGHEAFTAMRARGAQATDIVVLIVAADDAVMPQTVEAISHAQAANVPIIVAINKVDKPNANTEKIRQQLADKNILVEDWGGKYQSVEISAKSGQNVDQLLEKILLEAEILELKANPDRNARGIVIESEIDKGRGVTATVLVQKGVLRVGDPFIAGQYFGRVRAMFDERNKKVEEAGPSTPVLVLGIEGAPQAGDTFIVTETERIARDTSTKRQQLKREQEHKQVHHVTLDEISKQISLGGVKELPIIVKADVDGSVEALADSLMKLGTEEVVVKVIHRGVGAISENDVLLANASGAIIVGFHVRPNLNARKMAEKEKVDIRIYHVIYDAVNEVKSALEGLLSPIISEEVTSTVEVRDIFKVPKAGMVAGCYVLDGTIHRNDKVRLIRDNVEIYDGEISSLKRFKDDVREVEKGYECGISIENYNDIKVGDIIEGYKVVETKKKLK